MTRWELFDCILGKTKFKNQVFLILFAFAFALLILKYNMIISIIYAILLVTATHVGSAQGISRRAFKKADNLVCDELYLAYDNRFSFTAKTYLISVEGDLISRINCLRKGEKEVLEDISNTDLDANTITLEEKQYILFKMK